MNPPLLKEKNIHFLFFLFAIVFFAYSVNSLGINVFRLIEGFPNLVILVSDSIPPDTSVMEVGLISLVETIQIAFVGTVFGAIVSFPLAVLSARNLSPKQVFTVTRFFLAAVRTIPSLLWAIIFVIVVGFGNFAGVLAIAFYTVGYLAKLQYEAIEGINPDVLEAIHAVGAKKLQLVRFVVIPEAANSLLSQLLFMFEYNVRASTIIGFVGAGGIGFYISAYLRFLEYDKVFSLLLVVFLAVLAIDFISLKIRDRFLVKKEY
ncbi:MAG: phosphonate ABC transporter, permease protein PhnE [Candidatus Diapherotrites archaeon]|nr:phosphonate ABC transporter, permease protein PhnE [Candidatus Diapherotrites archaeon]